MPDTFLSMEQIDSLGKTRLLMLAKERGYVLPFDLVHSPDYSLPHCNLLRWEFFRAQRNDFPDAYDKAAREEELARCLEAAHGLPAPMYCHTDTSYWN